MTNSKKEKEEVRKVEKEKKEKMNQFTDNLIVQQHSKAVTVGAYNNKLNCKL